MTRLTIRLARKMGGNVNVIVGSFPVLDWLFLAHAAANASNLFFSILFSFVIYYHPMELIRVGRNATFQPGKGITITDLRLG